MPRDLPSAITRVARSRRVLPQVDRPEIAAIFAGGALGTLLRAALAESFVRSAPTGADV